MYALWNLYTGGIHGQDAFAWWFGSHQRIILSISLHT